MSLKFRDLDRGSREYEDNTYPAHVLALEVVREAAPRRLLDIGCGSGTVARACREMGIEVTGVDRREPEPGAVDHFEEADLTRPLPLDAFEHDVVLLLDVLEELQDPERLLLDMRNRSRVLRPGSEAPLVVVATPNVAFITNRLALLFGRFNYTNRGILDITHSRLFNRVSLRRTLRDCGYQIEKILAVPVPWKAVIGGRRGRWLETGSRLLARIWPGAFAFQFLVTCRPMPGVAQVLGAREPLGPGGGEFASP